MRPKLFINIATNEIGGPGKGILQFLRCGGGDICDPVIVGFCLSNKKGSFDKALEEALLPHERLIQRRTYDPFLVPQAMRIVKNYKTDILQSHGYKSHLICLVLKYMTGLPWVAFFHGWTSGGYKIKFYNYLEKVLLGFADRVVPVSQSMVNKLNHKWIDKKKIWVIHNAVDPGEYSIEADHEYVRARYGVKCDEPLVAVIGRLSPEKGHRFLIDALPEIHRELPKLKVMFIGDGPLRENLQQRVTLLNLSKSVIFTGFQNELGGVYRGIDLLILPSLSEGMPNVALEAMLFGKPVVATRVGGVPEVVLDGKTGILVDRANSQQLAYAIIKMFKNPDLLRSQGMAGRERVLKDFNPAQRVKKIAALYEDVLTRKVPLG